MGQSIQLEPIGGNDYWFNTSSQYNDRRIVGIFSSANMGEPRAKLTYMVDADSAEAALEILRTEGVKLNEVLGGGTATVRVETVEFLKGVGAWCVTTCHEAIRG